MRRSPHIALLLLPLVLLFTTPAAAQEEEQPESHGTATHEGRTRHSQAHLVHKNHVAAFVGGVTHLKNDDTGATVGGHYTRLLNSRWAVGVIGEYASSDLERNLIVIAGAGFVVTRGWGLLAGVGTEFASREEEHDGHVETEDVTELLVRIGTTYTISLGGSWSLNPEFVGDWTKHTWTLVYGASVGYGF